MSRVEGTKRVHTGFFDIKRFAESTGKAHMVEIKCTLCHETFELDLRKTGGDAVTAAEKLAAEHVCKKPGKPKIAPLPPKLDVEDLQESGTYTREERIANLKAKP